MRIQLDRIGNAFLVIKAENMHKKMCAMHGFLCRTTGVSVVWGIPVLRITSRIIQPPDLFRPTKPLKKKLFAASGRSIKIIIKHNIPDTVRYPLMLPSDTHKTYAIKKAELLKLCFFHSVEPSLKRGWSPSNFRPYCVFALGTNAEPALKPVTV